MLGRFTPEEIDLIETLARDGEIEHVQIMLLEKLSEWMDDQLRKVREDVTNQASRTAAEGAK